MNPSDDKNVLKFYIFVHIKKYLDFCVNGGESTPNVYMIYFNALYIFKLEINLLKIIVIWFVKGSHNFKIPIKYDFFS